MAAVDEGYRFRLTGIPHAQMPVKDKTRAEIDLVHASQLSFRNLKGRPVFLLVHNQGPTPSALPDPDIHGLSLDLL